MMAFWEEGINAFYRDGHIHKFLVAALGWGIFMLFATLRGK